MRYDGFISYSHESDSTFARAFQTGLEQLAKPWNRRRALDVFRDETDLSISPELLGTIFQVLDQSSHFLLLASPRAAGSKWVQQEVEHWVSERSTRSLLIILTGGELVWDDNNHDFDWDRTDALPKCLRGRFAGEPLWVDFRWARQEKELTLKQDKFRDEVATVAAELHGMSKRDLVGEDLRQHQKFLRVKRIVTVAGAALLAGVLLASYLAVRQGRLAEQRRTNALARRLASGSASVVNDQAKLIEVSLLLAAEAVRRQPLPESEDAIRKSLALYPKEVRYEGIGKIHRIAFSADSSMAAVAGDDNNVSVLELPTGKVLWHQQQPPSAVSLALADGHLAAAGEDGIIRLMDVSKNNKVGELAVGKAVVAMAFSPDGSELVAGQGKYVHVLEAPNWKETAPLDSGEEVNHVAFSRDGQLWVTGHQGMAIFSRKNNRWTRTRVEAPQTNRPGDETALSANGQYWVSCGHMASQAKNCRVTNVSGGADVSTLVHPDLVRFVVFSPDNRYVATVSRDEVVRVFETGTGQAVSYLPEKASATVFFSPDSRYMVTSSDESLRLYQLSSETVVRTLPGGRLISAAFSADGRYVAHGGSAEVFDLGAARPLQLLKADLTGRAVALSADGHFLAISNPTRVLDLNSGNEVYRNGSQSMGGMGLAFSSDAKYLAVGMMASVQLIDITGHTPPFERSTGPLRSVALSGDGKYLATGAENAALLISWAEKKELHSLKHAGLVHSVAVSADGHYMASGGVDNQVLVYDVVNNKELKPLPLEQTVLAITFSPDSQYIATGGLDRTTRVFSLANGEEVAHFYQEAAVIAILFSPDGRQVITAAGQDTRQEAHPQEMGERPFVVMRHLLRPEDLVDEACARLTRNLTSEEWKLYIGDEPYRKTCPNLQ